MIATVANWCLLALALSAGLCVVRLLRGPSVPDRALALDTLAVNLIGIIGILCIRDNTVVYFDAVLVIAVLGFVSTVAVAKYLLKGDIID
ncbi:MAG: Na(+)/H(+) antiporter subunit F [Verrucomicrobiae bacterium]|nr:Na(+)/H(+) antiporter subunit F [Verrucomicrobiae bacterium]